MRYEEPDPEEQHCQRDGDTSATSGTVIDSVNRPTIQSQLSVTVYWSQQFHRVSSYTGQQDLLAVKNIEDSGWGTPTVSAAGATAPSSSSSGSDSAYDSSDSTDASTRDRWL